MEHVEGLGRLPLRVTLDGKRVQAFIDIWHVNGRVVAAPCGTLPEQLCVAAFRLNEQRVN